MGHSANKGSSPKSDLNLKKRKRVNPFMVILTLFLIGFLGYQLLSKQISQKVQVSPSVLLEDLKNPETATVKVMLGNTMASVVWSVGNGPDIQVKATQIPLDSVDGYFTQEIIASLGDEFQFIPQPPSSSEIFGNILTLLMFAGTLVLVVLFFKGMKNGGPGQAMSFGKIRPQTTEDPNETVTFEDVAGQAEAKQELQEVVDFLKNPDEYHAIGAKIPRGVLLVGMPGTGKTLLARAVAGEAGVSFFHISGSDFVEMFVGVGASRVRDLFEQGRAKAPCIIFIDELDAVGRTRGAGYGGGHDEREQTLNQMLVEMDGFKPTDNVIVLAATNRPDVLDPALLRPGRFDRQVVVDMPDVKEREAILSVHAKKIKTSRSVDLERIAKATPGSSGAELANLVNEAALFAARKKAKKVTMEDFEEARDKLLMGVARRSRVITDEEKLATAYHESGHALLHYYLKHADPLHKVTIIPRGRAAGVTFSLPEKELHFQRKSQLLDRIKLCMGGFVAEKLVYGETTTGTQNDIKQATEIARKMVREFGMSEKMGFLSFGDEDEPIFLGKEFGHAKIYSDETSRFIDEEIKRIIDFCMADATQLLSDHRSDLDLLAHELVARETMEDNDVRKLLGMELIESKFALVDRPEPEPATQLDEPSPTEAAYVSLPASDETESPALPAAAQPSGGDSTD